MIGGHSSRGLGRQFIELAGGDPLVDSSADLLGHQNRVAVVEAKPIAELLQASRNLVEMDRLLAPVSLHHVHDFVSEEFRRTGSVRRKARMKRKEQEEAYI